MRALSMNHRNGKQGTLAHEAAVNDEQTGTEMQPGRRCSNTHVCFKVRYLKRQQKPFLFKETPEPAPASPLLH